jgi:hypothetical protein
MEAVEDMQSLRASLADHLKVGLPHVRADENDLGDHFFTHGGEESLEGFDRSFLAHPEQTGDAEVDLIDQGKVLVAFGVLDFIDADGVNLAQRAVLQAPGDNVFDGIKNLFPGSAKRLGRFFPGKAARPAGQEEHVDFGQGVFAVAPGDFLHHHGAAATTVDAAHGI